MTETDIKAHLAYMEQEQREAVLLNIQLRPYWARLSTRIVVTDTMDAHLKEDAPKDVAVYYYVPGAAEWSLPYWRLAIIEAWLSVIVRGQDINPVTGPRSFLPLRCPKDLAIVPLTQAQRDDCLYDNGYNVVHWKPGYGYLLYGDIIWRNGQPVTKRDYNDQANIYKHVATPLALLE